MRTYLSRSAAEFLREQVAYLKSHSLRAASSFTASIRKARKNLEAFPDLGMERDRLPIQGARTLVVGDYLLDYVRQTQGIEIVSIRHHRQRPLTPEMDESDDRYEVDADEAPTRQHGMS